MSLTHNAGLSFCFVCLFFAYKVILSRLSIGFKIKFSPHLNFSLKSLGILASLKKRRVLNWTPISRDRVTRGKKVWRQLEESGLWHNLEGSSFSSHACMFCRSRQMSEIPGLGFTRVHFNKTLIDCSYSFVFFKLGMWLLKAEWLSFCMFRISTQN